MTLPFIPVKMRGGKNEEWFVSLGGTLLIGHPSFADRNSTLNYIELLQEEVKDGSFSPSG